jgi:hypothetical protein
VARMLPLRTCVGGGEQHLVDHHIVYINLEFVQLLHHAFGLVDGEELRDENTHESSQFLERERATTEM